MSLGTDFTSGFNMAFGAGMQAKQLKEDAKREKARQELAEDAIMQRHAEAREKRLADRQNEIEANNRFEAAQRAAAEEKAARAADPREQLARAKAERDLAQLDTPDPRAQLRGEIEQMKLEKERASLANPAPPAAPTAKVRQPIGPKGAGGFAEYEVPTSEVPNLARSSAAAGYKSPFARQIEVQDKIITEQQTAIDGGDNRTGFLGVGTSRSDVLGKAQRERLRLVGLELQDKVRAGVLTQEEADSEADRLLSGSR